MKIHGSQTVRLTFGGILFLFFFSTCNKTQEIPVEKMASILYTMMKDNKITRDNNLTLLEDALIEPYAQKAGFTANDFKYTVLRYEENSQKKYELGQHIGALLLDDLLRSLDSNRFQLMMDDIPDSHIQSSPSNNP